MNITAETEQQINKLYQAYLSLNEYEQVVLKLLAVIYYPMGVAKFNALLTAVGREAIFPIKSRIKGLSVEQRELLTERQLMVHTQKGLSLNPLLLNKLTAECITTSNYSMLVRYVEKAVPMRTISTWNGGPDKLIRARDAYFMGDNVDALLEFDKNPQVIDLEQGKVLVELSFLPFNVNNFLTLSDLFQYHSFAAWFTLNNYAGYSNDYLLQLLEDVCNKNPKNVSLAHLRAEIYLNALRFDDFRAVLAVNDNSCYALQLNATRLLLAGDFTASNALFKLAINAKNKLARRKRQYLAGNFGFFYRVCLLALAAKDLSYYGQIIEFLAAENNDKDNDYNGEYARQVFYSIVQNLLHGLPYNAIDFFPHEIYVDTPAYYYQFLVIMCLGGVWCGVAINPAAQKKLPECEAFFVKSGMHLFAAIVKQVAIALGTSKDKDMQAANIVNFAALVSRKADWDIALEKLIALNPVAASQESGSAANPIAEKPTRLIWEMSPNLRSASFKAREQKKTAKGWSKGRTVSLKRLSTEIESFPYLTEADKKMCAYISAYQSWDYYRSLEYSLDGAGALLAAKEVDYLCIEGDLDQPIELLQKEPELLINQRKDQLCLSMANLPPHLDNDSAFTLKEVSPGSYAFTLFNASHIKVARVIGEGGLMIPVSAKQKMLESVAAIAPLLNIQSNVDELDTGLETLACDEHLVINIQPLGNGLEFTCVVMPFGELGPAFKPMRGNVQLTAEMGGRRIATQRDLAREQVLYDALVEYCPAFLAMPDNLLALDDTQDALEVLEQLEHILNQDPMPILLRLRWPKGKKFNLSKTLSAQHLALAVNKKSEWFDLTGELTVNETQVIELRKLLELVSASSGRFVPLDNGQILALSHDLRERLGLLNQTTDGGKFHPLASLQVAEATTGMRMKTIHAWENQAKKMHEANALEPKVPPTLQAQLREYQQEGFEWMSRLAHWDAGACLADDMGLGKTLQALALLVARAAQGPSLVIAPTSVSFNWQQEALKFAPTLNVRIFAESTTSALRQQLLDNLAPFDCVIISYGLLQRESELLAQVQWHTIVADEAQALKNPLAQRTQAAYALKGDFKIITTGTPIENNLTELWSLFRFITPGLLGSLKGFGKRYAQPIENVKEDKLAARKASLALKTLIQPFILRRMKNQVLTELPSRTEINIHVELSQKEKDFYEALRRNAVDNIAKASKTASEGEQRIKMLAELVKLRQACCNPKLVMAETELPSAKLEALSELLDELQKNNHKALIFSQFVGHLQLIKQHLDERGISYQYLDGSTPLKARQERVNAFQKGEGEVFLISLKAGGAGLNLTAADYVIHMDPWWNPAVEEQASDRAHRMGQKRPVTIYRLIAKHTIEERIVALHQHKRDLADKLLAGNEQATKLSVDDVLNMLKENF